jgi:uncharacterized SAM-binding protein YcdF (DUF218 family)
MFTRRSSVLQGVLLGIALTLVGQWAIDRTPFADWLVSPLLLPDTNGRADVIVVAGAGVLGPCEPNLSAVRRVLKATDLWRQGRAPYVFFTGGPSGDLPCAVADVMADLATRAGIPRERILTEGTSGSTRENAFYAAPVLEALEARSLLLVTDRLHMFRASRVFGALGYHVERVSVPVYATNRGNLDMLTGAARESLAVAYYWLRGELRQAGRLRTLPTGNARRARSGDRAPVVVLGASYAQGWRPDAIAGRPVLNRGVDGQQTFELAARLDADVLSHHPGVVVLWGVINDFFRAPNRDLPAASERAKVHYRDMIDRASAAGAEVVLATEVTIRAPESWTARVATVAGRMLGRTSYQDTINAAVREFNVWVRDTAAAEGLTVLDLERVTAAPDGTRRRRFAEADGSHLTDAAYAAVTRYAGTVLDRRFADRP